MAARRKRRTTRRRKKSGISILGVAETYMLMSVATKTLFNVDAATFVVGERNAPAFGLAAGTNKIGLRELFRMDQYPTNTGKQVMGNPKPTLEVIQENLKANAFTGIAGMFLIPLGFRAGKALARPAISRTNRLLGKAGIASTIKV